MIPTKFILHFSDISTIFYEFLKFELISRIFEQIMKFRKMKSMNSVGQNRPKATAHGSRWTAVLIGHKVYGGPPWSNQSDWTRPTTERRCTVQSSLQVRVAMVEPTRQGEGAGDSPKRRGVDEAAVEVQYGGVLRRRQCSSGWR
jgi:hypothetical protein